MKTFVSILIVSFAIVAFVQSSPLPQSEFEQAAEAEAAPSRPILNAINGFANTGMSVAKSVAESTGRFIEGSSKVVTNGINVAAQTISETINRPFQSVVSASESDDWAKAANFERAVRMIEDDFMFHYVDSKRKWSFATHSYTSNFILFIIVSINNNKNSRRKKK